MESDGTITVALDTELNDELIDEGLAREFVSRVQNLRKAAGLEVTDRIKIYCNAGTRVNKALERMATYVMQETLAAELTKDPPETVRVSKEDINGEEAIIGIEKVITIS